MNRQTPLPLFDRAFASFAFRLQRFAGRMKRAALRRRLRRLGLENAYAIHTWTRPEELEALYELAAQCQAGANIVELGSYLGASTCFLAAGAYSVGGTVTAIDLWNNETIAGGHRDTFAEFQRNTAGAAHLIRVLRKRTQELTPDDIRGPMGKPQAWSGFAARIGKPGRLNLLPRFEHTRPQRCYLHSQSACGLSRSDH
jgi:hypothetical protein